MNIIKKRKLFAKIFPVFILLIVYCPIISAKTLIKGTEHKLILLKGNWEKTPHGLVGSGLGTGLEFRLQITGDFVVEMKITLARLGNTISSFRLNRNNYFCFDGGQEKRMFIEGPFTPDSQKNKFLAKAKEYITPGREFNFSVIVKNKTITFMIDGEKVYSGKFTAEKIRDMAIFAQRNTMTVSKWTVQAGTFQIKMPRNYSIPVVDISTDKSRRVIVDKEKGRYTGHPTTVLLEDNKTMFCVYPYGHGSGFIMMKRSDDAGKTWSKRLKTPENWRTSSEGPMIYRMTDPKGKKRLILWTGLYPARMAISKDDGKNWSKLKKIGNWGGIAVPCSIVPLKTGKGHYLGLFHDDGRYFRKWEPGNQTDIASNKKARDRTFTLYKIFSRDGGLTWSFPEAIYSDNEIHLCEPCCIRSPDGKQLATLWRENKRVRNSYVIFSNDEGKTWSKPQELPGALTGDRHVAKYAPDGRLFISFRDTTHKSSTRGDWVGWVGTYEDILKKREGQYRVRLMNNFNGGDCGYAGVEFLPDGTFVATSYGHWTKGEPAYVVSVRFRLPELDKKLKKTKMN